ncbi:MAG TPA: porin [Pyrinomonadaceae bacterium]
MKQRLPFAVAQPGAVNSSSSFKHLFAETFVTLRPSSRRGLRPTLGLLSILAVLICLAAAGTNAQQPALTSAKATKPAAKPGIVLPPEKANPVRVVRFDKPPVIDGKLDDEVWKQALVLKDFYQVQPGDNTAPSKPTEVLLGYDSKFLYVAYRAFDEPDKVRATVAKRDSIFNDDYVGLFFDTFNDQRKAYEMNFNPLGIQADGVLTEGSGEDFSVDMVVESKGVVNSEGYTVEVAIPFKSLRYEAGKDKLWGIHFYRRIKRFNNELDMWMPLSRDKTSWLSQAGHLTGLEDISTERTLELIPSLTFSETGKRVHSFNPPPAGTDPGRLVNEPVKFDPGLTAKFGITPTVTLDLALNPDFAQVESDQLVVTANQRFPIFFEEKRPFFLEGIDIFRTPLTPVHTRAIIDPDVAVKLTGKRGRNTFGIMLASDNGPGNFTGDERLRAGNLRFLDKNAYIGVLRLKRDVGKDSSLGMIATSYSFIEKHNQLLGVDGRLRIDPQTTFTFQAIGTNSRRFFYNPDLDQSIYRTGNGFGYYYTLNRSGRHFTYQLQGQGRTIDYRADVGFTRRRNTNYEDFFIQYKSEPKPKHKIIYYRLFNSIRTNFDWQARTQAWEDEAQFMLSLPRQTFLGAGMVTGYERLFEEEFGARRTVRPCSPFGPSGPNDPPPCTFRGGPERSTYQQSPYFFIESNPSKTYSFNVFVLHTRNAFDLDFGGGDKFPRVSPAALLDPDAQQDPGPGGDWEVTAGATYQPTSALRASLNYTKSRLQRYDTGRVAFDDNIFSLRTTYQFSRFTFARGRVDYDTLASSVRGQFLLGWTPNPGTAFYLGYNDDLSRNGFNPFTGDLEPGFRRNGRTFFIKMSYLFRRSF